MNADAVLARRWTDGATGYVLGSCKWNSFRSAWEAALAAAGIEGYRFHDPHHTFASWLVQRGGTMTMRYSHLGPDHLRAAVAALDGMLPAPQSESAKTSAQDSAQELIAETIKGSR